jgi:hypothetical protein
MKSNMVVGDSVLMKLPTPNKAITIEGEISSFSSLNAIVQVATLKGGRIAFMVPRELMIKRRGKWYFSELSLNKLL